jgi:AcrR family transcriptional regulator
VAGAWLREEQSDLAVEKILEAASHAFQELGVGKASMADIARYAGCSRGTLYRYFQNRHQLHLAYVDDQARKLSVRVRAAISGIEDPRERLVEGVMRAVAEARGTPGTAAWFAVGDSGIAARASGRSQGVEAALAAFTQELLGPTPEAASGGADPGALLRANWLLRAILSLLTMPAGSEAEERALVERFVAPVILAPS